MKKPSRRHDHYAAVAAAAPRPVLESTGGGLTFFLFPSTSAFHKRFEIHSFQIFQGVTHGDVSCSRQGESIGRMNNAAATILTSSPGACQTPCAAHIPLEVVHCSFIRTRLHICFAFSLGRRSRADPTDNERFPTTTPAPLAYSSVSSTPCSQAHSTVYRGGNWVVRQNKKSRPAARKRIHQSAMLYRSSMELAAYERAGSEHQACCTRSRQATNRTRVPGVHWQSN